ncbi:MAG: hypothetical protein HZB19_09245 [Chloroflexi bacterium]|nr:hypothetical protein [Chloroflexota bacterium]
MPISEEALTGLRAAIQWNPYGARELLAILKEFPAWMKYKDDPYGPLGLILFGVVPRRRIADGLSVPMKTAPFPEDKFTACRVFGGEWKQRAFTKQELADSIEAILAELNIRF